MTREEIMNMEAGYDMDKLIDFHLFGFEVPNYPLPEIYLGEDDYWHLKRGGKKVRTREKGGLSIPKYSTDIKDAWEVVEKLSNETGCDVVKVCKRDPELLRGEWSCNFGRGYEAFGDTASLAICRAALMMMIGEIK